MREKINVGVPEAAKKVSLATIYFFSSLSVPCPGINNEGLQK